VLTGAKPLAERLDGTTVEATVARFDPRTMSGSDLLHALSVSMDAHASVPDLEVLPVSLPAGMAIHGGAEIRRSHVRVSSGIVKSDHLELVAPRVVVTTADGNIAGALALDADVAPSGGEDRLSAHAEIRDAELSRLPWGGASLHAPRVIATGDAADLDLARPLEDLHFVVEIPEGTIAASALSHAIPSNTPVAIAGGQAQVSARVEGWMAQQRLAGQGSLRSENLEVRLANMLVRGHTSIQAGFGSYGLGTRSIEDGSLAIRVHRGSLSSASHPDVPLVLIQGARLDASAPIVDLADPVRRLRVSLSMPDSEVASEALLAPYLPRGAGTPTGARRSPFSLEGRLTIVDHLAQGSLDITSSDFRVDYGPMRFGANLGVRALVHDWHWETGELRLDHATVDVRDAKITDSRSVDPSLPPAMTVAHVAVDATSPRFQLARPLALVKLSGQVENANVRDSAAVNAMLPPQSSFTIDADDAHLEGRLVITVENHIAWGMARAKGTNIGARGAAMRLRGDVDLMADFVGWNLQRYAIAWLDARLAMTHARGRLGSHGPSQVTVDRVSLLTRSPNFAIPHPSLRGADFHLVVERAAVPDLGILTPLLSTDGSVGIASGAASAAADVRVSSSQGTASGAVDVDVVRAGVWLDQKYLLGNLRLRARLDGFDPDSEVLDITGSRLEMRDVAVSSGSATTTDWHGDVLLAPASLRLAHDPLFDGVVGLEARDARALLALAVGDSLPGFVVGLVAMPGLSASARVVAAAHQLALLDVAAQGGNVGIRGSYASRETRSRGAFVVRKAVLSLGIGLNDNGTWVRFFGLQRWLREQTHDVRKLLEVH
jgi:hypothetical protein